MNKALPEYLFSFIQYNYEDCTRRDQSFVPPSEETIRQHIRQYVMDTPFAFEAKVEKKRMGRPVKNQKETVVAEDCGLQSISKVSRNDIEQSNEDEIVGDGLHLEVPKKKEKKERKSAEEKEAEVQAKKEAKEKEIEEKKAAKEAELQAKKEAKEAELQAKKDAKEAELQAKKDAKQQEKEAKKQQEKKEKKEKKEKDDNGEVKKRGRPAKNAGGSASKEEIQAIKDDMQVAIQEANDAIKDSGLQLVDNTNYTGDKMPKKVKVSATHASSSPTEKVSKEKKVPKEKKEKKEKAPKEKKEKKGKDAQEEKEIKSTIAEMLTEAQGVSETLENLTAMLAKVEIKSPPCSPQAAATNDIDFGEEQEEEYEEFADFVESPKSAKSDEEEEEVAVETEKFTYEDVDYYVDKNLKLESEDDEDWYAIKVCATHKVVGRASSKTKEMFEDSDEEDDEEEEEEEDDDDDDGDD